MTEEYSLKLLDKLSFPRGYHPLCELTGLKAKYELTVTRNDASIVLHYSSKEIAEQAFEGIIKKIVLQMIPLMAPTPTIDTTEERLRREESILVSKRSIMDFCLAESSNLLSTKNYLLAVPAVTQALKFCKEIDGERSLAVIEPYLLLAQAYLGLDDHRKSEELLSLARWIAMSSKNCSNSTMYRLHMLMGRVNTVRDNHEVAKSEYASSIYYASCCYGPEAIPTSIGYFRLGDVFLGLRDFECSLAFFDKVVDIWCEYLSSLHAAATSIQKDLTEKNMLRDSQDLSEEILADGHIQLQRILDTRSELLGVTHLSTGEAQYTLGLFKMYLMGDMASASAHLKAAQRTYDSQLGADHPSAFRVTSCLEMISIRMQSMK